MYTYKKVQSPFTGDCGERIHGGKSTHIEGYKVHFADVFRSGKDKEGESIKVIA